MTFLTLHGSIQWTFILHILVGATALLILSIPLFSKKGGKLHVRTGWIYTIAMILVCASAFIITPWRAFFDESRTIETQARALFLFFIAVFTLATVHYGLAAVKFKKRELPSKSILHIGPPIFVIALSLLTQAIGLKIGNTLLIVFPFLALFSSKGQLEYWLKSPTTKRHWWYAHMSGMVIACIATVTAFLVTAAPRIWPGPFTNSAVLWVAPGIIGVFFLKKWTARYRTEFGDV